MIDRKELKSNAKRSLKKHYWLFVAICLFAVFIGAEYGSSLDVLRTDMESADGEETVLELSNETLGASNSDIVEGVVNELLMGRIQEGREMSRQAEKELKENDQSKVLARDKGVFSDIANAVSSGKLYVEVFERADRVFGSKNFVAVSFIILSMLFHLALLFYIKDCFVVTSRRFFLEGRIYDKIPLTRLGYLPRAHKWSKAAFTMFKVSLYKTLWAFTIVAIPIKHYSYFLVPYIVAENPDIKAGEAITLSRKMMYGHKWECFKIFLSFIPWFLLDYITIGLVSIFYTNAYRTAVYCEYYAKLRAIAIENGIEGAELMNDEYLFRRPDTSEMEESYGDVLVYINEPVPKAKEAGGIRGFMEKWLGIMLLGTESDLEYEKERAREDNIRKLKNIFSGETYPERLFPASEIAGRISLDTPHYVRNYSILSLIMLFFIFSFIGWMWEVSLHLVRDGVFVNRGVLHGPWLPIYGAGGVMILVLLNRFRRKPVVEFIAAVVLCGFVEYFTSLFLEVSLGHKWWDYSGYFLNLNGRICGEGLLTFGMGGMAIVYLLAPALDSRIRKIKLKVLIPICLVLVCLFATDQIYSSKHPNEGKGITSYGSVPVIERVCGSDVQSGDAGGARDAFSLWCPADGDAADLRYTAGDYVVDLRYTADGDIVV